MMEKRSIPDTRWVRYTGAVTERHMTASDWRNVMGTDDKPAEARDIVWTRRTGHMVPRQELSFMSDASLEAFMRADGNFVLVDTDTDPLPEESTVTDTRKS